MIPGFKEAIVGMCPGETRTARVMPEKAFGRYREEFIMRVDRERLPVGVFPGERLRARGPDGRERTVTVMNVTEGDVTVDANHRLAGKELVFDIELVEIV